MKTVFASAAALMAAATYAPAMAQDFSGLGLPEADPTFAGPVSVATFTGTNQSFSSYSENGITISAGRISSSFADNYNSFGSYYDNNAGALSSISIGFASPVDAFAFNWGAADVIWNLQTFAGSTLIQSYALAFTGPSNRKEYFGFTGNGITSATLTASSPGDWVFIDNITIGATGDIGAVPEPSTWAMMLLGFAVMGAALRRSRRPATAGVTYA